MLRHRSKKTHGYLQVRQRGAKYRRSGVCTDLGGICNSRDGVTGLGAHMKALRFIGADLLAAAAMLAAVWLVYGIAVAL